MTSRDDNQIGAVARSIGERLQARRKYMRLSQHQVAIRLGVSRATYGHWETGESSVSAEDLEKLSRIYKVQVSYFFGDDEHFPEFDAPSIQSAYQGLDAHDRDVINEMIFTIHRMRKNDEITYGRKSE